MKRKKLFLALFDLGAVAFILCLPMLLSLLPKVHDCPMERFGMICPSCFGTECVGHLLRLQIPSALRANAFVVAVVGFLLFLWVLWHLSVFCKMRRAEWLLEKLTHYKVIIGFAVFWAIFGLLRNLF